jgi:hypothetical protein
MYFQIPLMVLVILPAVRRAAPPWREAAPEHGRQGMAVLALHRDPRAGTVGSRGDLAAVRQRAFSAYATAGGADQRDYPADLDPDRLVPERQHCSPVENVGYALGLGW